MIRTVFDLVVLVKVAFVDACPPVVEVCGGLVAGIDVIVALVAEQDVEPQAADSFPLRETLAVNLHSALGFEKLLLLGKPMKSPLRPAETACSSAQLAFSQPRPERGHAC